MGVSEGGSRRKLPLKFGMHVVDVHDQILGSVILVRRDHFVVRQELAENQLVELPSTAIAGVIGGLVFLTLTPAQLYTCGRVLERRERGTAASTIRPRVAALPVPG